MANETWDLVDKPKRILSYIQLKARLIVSGHEQRKGIDYDEVFTPVIKLNATKPILAVGVEDELVAQTSGPNWKRKCVCEIKIIRDRKELQIEKIPAQEEPSVRT